MSATVRLVREGFGIELRRGPFDICLDGTGVGAIDWKETIEMAIEPGHHALRLRAGRYRSRGHEFDVADGEVAAFRCHGALIWPLYVASIVVPELAIQVHRD